MSESQVQFGYRMPNGTEVWADNYGTDGAWTTADPNGVNALTRTIDTYDGQSFKNWVRQLDGEAEPISRELITSYGRTVTHDATLIELGIDWETLSTAIGKIVCNNKYYPNSVGVAMLGQDMSNLRGAVTAAVVQVLREAKA